MHYSGGPDILRKRMVAFESVATCLHEAQRQGPVQAVAKLASELKSLDIWDHSLDEAYFQAAGEAPVLPTDLLEHVLGRFEKE
jgi:hypothetical protein